MGAGVPAWLAWVLLRRMSREFVPLFLTGIFEGLFTFILALLFGISGTGNTGSYGRHLLPAETRGAIAPVRGNVPRISNKSASSNVSRGPILPVFTNSLPTTRIAILVSRGAADSGEKPKSRGANAYEDGERG